MDLKCKRKAKGGWKTYLLNSWPRESERTATALTVFTLEWDMQLGSEDKNVTPLPLPSESRCCDLLVWTPGSIPCGGISKGLE